MTDHHYKAVIDAINHMFNRKKSFSICTVRNCMEVLGINENADFKALELYHCHDYSDMDDDTKKWIYQTTLKLICGGPQFPTINIAEPEPPAIEMEQPKKRLRFWK